MGNGEGVMAEITQLRPGGSPPLILQGATNPEFVFVRSLALASGDNEVYTVPANRKAWVVRVSLHQPAGGSTIATHLKQKISGTSYRVSANANLTSQGVTSHTNGNILEEGDILVVNIADVGAGINAYCKIIEFDAGTGPTLVRTLSLTTGDNTIYTTPVGKEAFVLSVGLQFNQNMEQPGILIANESGVASTFTVYRLQSGESVEASKQVNFSASIADNGVTEFLMGAAGYLPAGASIVVNTSDDGDTNQRVWLVVQELDAGELT